MFIFFFPMLINILASVIMSVVGTVLLNAILRLFTRR